MQLTDREWKEFYIGDLFDIEQGKGKVDKDTVVSNGIYNIATASTINNGIIYSNSEQDAKIRSGNNITIGRQTGIAFYQANKYFETDNILILSSNKLDENIGKFIAAIYNESLATKFSYGRVASIGKLRSELIRIPIDCDGNPDYNFMQHYIVERESSYTSTKSNNEQAIKLEDRKWREFKISDLLELKIAKSNDKGNLRTGDVPFIGRSNGNNGLQGFYDVNNVTNGKCITLGMVGTFRAFWQERDFAASQNILTMRAHWLNKYNALFICNIIEQAIDGKYSYGKSIKASTFGETILNIPITPEGNPDYDFMEQYIKSLPFSIVI